MAFDETNLLSGTGLPPVLPSLAKPKPQASGMPSLGPATPFTGLPPVTALNPSPEQSAVGAARNQLEKDQNTPSLTAGLWNKAGKYHEAHPGFVSRLGQVGAGVLRGVDIGAEMLAPNIARNIPGTGLNRSANIARDTAALSSAEANAKTAAETTKDTAEANKAIYGDPLEAQREQFRADEENKKEAARTADQNAREEAQNRRTQEIIAAEGQRQEKGTEEANKRQQAGFEHMDASQQKLFAQQNALEDKRLAAQTKNVSRQDVRAHDKEYVVPAEGKEQTYKVFEGAYRDYLKAKIAGKKLPTGAQSMVALSAHLGTTFGGVKGNRVTRDLIEKHLGARGISDKAVVAFQRFTNGDELSPDQWKAFFDLVKSSRDESWSIAKKEAERKGIPVDFLPEDLANAPGTKK